MGLFLSDDLEEVEGRFLDDDGILLEVVVNLRNPASMDEIVSELTDHLPEDYEEIADSRGLTPAEAACRMEYGRAFNEEVAREATSRGHDALLVDNWTILMDLSSIVSWEEA